LAATATPVRASWVKRGFQMLVECKEVLNAFTVASEWIGAVTAIDSTIEDGVGLGQGLRH
jgi:hypothetical protein